MGCHDRLSDEHCRYYKHFVSMALDAHGILPWDIAEPELQAAWRMSGMPIEWADVRDGVKARWLSAALAATSLDR